MMAEHESSDSSSPNGAQHSHHPQFRKIPGRQKMINDESHGALGDGVMLKGFQGGVPPEGAVKKVFSLRESTSGLRKEGYTDHEVQNTAEPDWLLIHDLQEKLQSCTFRKPSSRSSTASGLVGVGESLLDTRQLSQRFPMDGGDDFLKRRFQRVKGSLLKAVSNQILKEAASLQTESCGGADPSCSAGSNAANNGSELPFIDGEVDSLLKLTGSESTEDLKDRIRSLGFWFSKVGGDLNVWIVRAVNAHQQLLETQRQTDDMQQRLIQQAAVLQQQQMEICSARKERDDLLEQIFRLKASADGVGADSSCTASADEKAIIAQTSKQTKQHSTQECGTTMILQRGLQQQVDTLRSERDDMIGRLYYEQQKNRELKAALEKHINVCCREHQPKIEEQEAALAAAAEELQQLQRQLIQYKVKYAESAFELQFQGASQSERGRQLQSPRLNAAAFDSLRHPTLRNSKTADGLAASFKSHQVNQPVQLSQMQDGSTYFSPRGQITVTAHSSPVVPPLQLQLLQNQTLDEQGESGESAPSDKNQPLVRDDNRWTRALGGPKKFLSKVFGNLTARETDSSSNALETTREHISVGGRYQETEGIKGDSRDSSGSSSAVQSDGSQPGSVQGTVEAEMIKPSDEIIDL